MSIAATPDLAFLEAIRHAIKASGSDAYTIEGIEEFCASRLWIVDKDARQIPLNLRPIQRRYLEMKKSALKSGKPPWYLLLKYRQGGFTTLEQALSYHMIMTRPNSRVLSLAEHGGKTATIFNIVKNYHARDPMAPAKKATGNSYQLVVPGTNCSFHCGTAWGKTEGRGGTYQRIHGSEVAWWCQGGDQATKQRNLLAGLQEAAGNNEIVLETTPNGSEHFRELYEKAKRGENDWTPIFLPWFEDEFNAIATEDGEGEDILKNLSDREAELIELHSLTPEQIKWRRVVSRRLGPLFRQEHPEDDVTCFMTSGLCRFDVQKVMARLEQLPDYIHSPSTNIPIKWINSSTYEVRWEEPEKDVSYVAGVDTSEGLPDSNPNGIGIMRRDNAKQVASIHGHLTPKELAEHSVRICKEYNNALLGIERENHGHAVLQRVIQIGYRQPNRHLFYYAKDRPGWTTNHVTREGMIEDLAEAVIETDLDWINDRQLLQEMLSFNRQGNNHWGHDSGAQDDTLFKWMIAMQMRKQRKKVSGISYIKSRRS